MWTKFICIVHADRRRSYNDRAVWRNNSLGRREMSLQLADRVNRKRYMNQYFITFWH